jgi:CBS domain-containing protein
MDVIQQRIDTNQTGSHWMVKSFNNLAKNNSREQALTAVTKAMIKNQKKGEPSYKWPMAHIDDIENWKPSMLLVEEFMTTDLFTVQKDDILEFVAYLLEWRKIRYAPVEDDQKHLVGIVTMRMVLREYAKELAGSDDASHTVEQIMIENPITIHPEASILESINIMQDNKIGCLPVVKNNRLVGVITEHNFMDITRNLLNRLNHNI